MSPNGYSIFCHGIDLLGASTLHYEDKDYDSMVWFVLNNCEEVDEYKEWVIAVISFMPILVNISLTIN